MLAIKNISPMKIFILKFMDKFCLPGEKFLKVGNRTGADRRTTLLRRVGNSIKYFNQGGEQKRTHEDRRQQRERRQWWRRSSQWSSIFMPEKK